MQGHDATIAAPRQAAARAVPDGPGGLRQIAKDAVFTGYCLAKDAAAALRLRSSTPNVIVLLYHRVNDALRDDVTCGVRRFDEHIAYLARRHAVVPLRALVRNEVDHRGPRPLVCVTFDDGYLDNYEHAAPILVKHKVPATFFVSTDKITNQTFFDHDLSKLGYGLPNMSWDNIREMQRDGLDFGSHTVTHANLARATPEDAWRELMDSREALRRELGHEEFLFAYPFGGRGDITPEVLDMVPKAGYACCCSAFGGSNTLPLNRYDIQRCGVNYKFSLAALKSRLYGWTKR